MLLLFILGGRGTTATQKGGRPRGRPLGQLILIKGKGGRKKKRLIAEKKKNQHNN